MLGKWQGLDPHDFYYWPYGVCMSEAGLSGENNRRG